MSVVALLFAYAGWVSLCLAMPKHHRQLRHREVSERERWSWRASGATLLTLSLVAAIHGYGLQIGPVAWFAALAVSGWALVTALPYSPRGCLRMAWMTSAIGAVIVVGSLTFHL